MPKLKTKKGIKKRFRMTKTGKFKHGKAGKGHLLGHTLAYSLLEELRHPPAGVDLNPRVGIGKGSPFRGNEKIAVKSNFQTACNSDAIDCPDNRFSASAYDIRKIPAITRGVEDAAGTDFRLINPRAE